MPELPEVETIVRGLSKFMPAKPISCVATGSVKKFKPRGITKLVGKTFVKICRRGKNIVIELDNGQYLVIHLGMTGQLYWANPDHRTDRHNHLRLDFGNSNRSLYFRDVRRFGKVKLFASKARAWADKSIAKLGPEPLQIGLGEFRKLLQRHRMIKALLLDQGVIVGFGNIYTDEILFAAKIHPGTPADQIGPAATARLYRAMKRIFKEAIATGGSSIRDYRDSEGQLGRFQTKHKVYQKTGKNCPRCQTKIQRLIIAGRSTHICSACQVLDS